MSFVFKRLLLAVQRGRESRARLWLSLFVRCLRWTFGEGRVTQRSSKREPHMDKSHFILLHSALKLKKLFSVERTIFLKHFPLVLHFFQSPRQDITSLVYPDGFHQAQAVWLYETRQNGLSAPSLCCKETFSARTLSGKHHCSRRSCF